MWIRLYTWLLNKKNKKECDADIYLNNIKLKEASHYKYLGLTIANDLTWNLHIDGIMLWLNRYCVYLHEFYVLTCKKSIIWCLISISVVGSSICFLTFLILASKALISLCSCSTVVLQKAAHMNVKSLIGYIFVAYFAASSNTLILSVKESKFGFLFSACCKINFALNIKYWSKIWIMHTNATKWIKFILGLFARISVIFCKDDSFTPAAFPAYPP